MEIQLITQKNYENLLKFSSPSLTTRYDRFVMVLDGAYSLSVDGESKTYIIRKNEIAFVPAATMITRELLEPTSYYHVSFVAQAEHPFRLALQTGKLTLPKEQISSIFNSMKKAVLMPSNQELLEHIIEHVLVENYLFKKSGKEAFRPMSESVLTAIRYMNVHLNEKIDMDLLAKQVYLSHSGLIWKFKQELNTTPSNYLTMLRLRYAKQLLLEHDYTVTEISEKCGFSNPYYFTNTFRRYEKLSPTDFRKSYLKRIEKKI